MKTYLELVAAVERWFDCTIGEPRAWTHDPPWTDRQITDNDLRDARDTFVYHTLGYTTRDGTEEQLVQVLAQDFEYLHTMARTLKDGIPEHRPRLLWRRQIRLERRGLVRCLTTRLAIPELGDKVAHAQGHRPEGEPFSDIRLTRPEYKPRGEP